MRYRNCLILLLIQLILVLAIDSGRASAANLYVSTSGNDNNPGTLDQPVANPQRAVDLGSAGDTVYLRAGTYNVSQRIQGWKPNMTMASYPNEMATIVPDNCDAIWIYQTDGITIRNLTFIGRRDQPNAQRVLIATESNNVTFADLDVSGGYNYCIKWDASSGDPGIPPRNSTGGQVLRCRLHDSGGKCVKLFNADSFLIQDCDIGPSGVSKTIDSGEGIDCIGSKGITVRHCHIHDTEGNGMYYKGSTSGGLVEQCLIENCGLGGILLGQDTDPDYMRDGNPYEAHDCVARNNIILNTQGAGLGTYSGSNIRFENNTLINVSQQYNGGFYVVRNSQGTSATNVTFQNNIVAMSNTDRPMAYIIQIADQLICDFNIWFKSDGSPYKFSRETATEGDYWNTFADWQTGVGVDQHSTTVNPALDAANLYKPLANSPAIDHGMTIAEVPADYLGAPRPQGSAYDIGAYEVAGAPPPPNPAVSITASATSGPAPLLVSFTSNASDPGGQIVAYKWDFGDGQTSTDPSPSHTYRTAGSFSAALTVTDNRALSATASVGISVSAAPAPPGCLIVPQTGTIYQNAPIASQSGRFTVTFDATPGAANSDAAFALSSGSQHSWTGLAAIVRFNTAGTIDARNGSNYSAATGLQYAANATYHIRMTVDVGARTYSVVVTAPGGSEQLIAQDYSFRTEQQGVANVDNCTVVAEAGSLEVCNVALSGSGGQPPPVQVQVMSPAASDVLVGGSSFTISWSVSGGQVSQVDISFSRDSGQSWVDVVTKLPGTATSFLWTVPRGKTRTGRIKVTASNAGGVQGQGESSGDFTIKKAKPSA